MTRHMRNVEMTAEQSAEFADALNEVVLRVSQAENVFALLGRLKSDGDFDGHHGLADMAELAAKALGALGDRELDTLTTLSNRLTAGS